MRTRRRYGTWHAVVMLVCVSTLWPVGTRGRDEEGLHPVRLGQAPHTADELALPLALWSEHRTEPEPMAIHVVRVDLQAPALQVIAIIGEDPDDDGPAEAALADPRDLARRNRALAAVNANAFSGLPDRDGQRSSLWYPGMPVEIAGLAVHAGHRRSGAHGHAGNDLCFWLDSQGRAHIGPVPDASADVREAVNAWWIDLVRDGLVLPKPGGDRHPRTAVGLDPGGRWLLLVVVDGRQEGYSAGMTAHELAVLMQHLGADRAINLDGGGSSILLARSADGEPEIINRPAHGPRPIPVLLGVVRR